MDMFINQPLLYAYADISRVEPFFYIHNLHKQAVKALASLHICAGSHLVFIAARQCCMYHVLAQTLATTNLLPCTTLRVIKNLFSFVFVNFSITNEML